jgi:hypothetical protein
VLLLATKLVAKPIKMNKYIALFAFFLVAMAIATPALCGPAEPQPDLKPAEQYYAAYGGHYGGYPAYGGYAAYPAYGGYYYRR